MRYKIEYVPQYPLLRYKVSYKKNRFSLTWYLYSSHRTEQEARDAIDQHKKIMKTATDFPKYID